jgi:hypothetical protein
MAVSSREGVSAVASRGMRAEGKPDVPYDPDAQTGRMFLVGCGVLVLVFIVGSALIGYLWSR